MANTNTYLYYTETKINTNTKHTTTDIETRSNATLHLVNLNARPCIDSSILIIMANTKIIQIQNKYKYKYKYR